MRTLVVLFALLCIAPAASVTVTPVQKVVEMLNSMAAKGKAEKEDEIESQKKVEKFCEGAQREKVRSIAENTAVVGKLAGEIDSLGLEVVELAAAIAKSDADIGVLGEKIANLDAKMDGIESEEADLSGERKDEHAIFEKKDNDYSDSVDALDRAVATMDKVTLIQEPAERRAALIQISADTKLPSKARSALAKYLKRDPTVSLLQIPTGEAAAYESQSGGIKELFEGLESKLADERGSGQAGEAEEKHGYDMMMLQLEDQLKNSKNDRAKKAANKAQTEQDLADATGQKAETEKAVAEDKKYLAELKAECEAKRKAFEERQATRAGEIEAIGQAVEILSGSAVSGAADKHLPGLLQTQKRGFKKSLAQLRSSVVSPAQKRVALFLQERATVSRSSLLSTIAQRAAQDPFAKINKMIKDMIAKLVAEANEEAEHKGFCDQELGANKATRDEKTEMVDTLNAEIEQLTAEENKLQQDISALSATVTELSEALSDATALRESEKTKNAATLADAKAAVQAVGQATTVLKEFYAKAALVQTEKGYSGNQDAASGVMNFLEVVLSDFTRLEEETTANESQAADDFAAFGGETNAAIETNNGDIKSKTTEKTQTAKSLQQAKTDLKNTQAELSAAFEYYDKLKPSCVDSGISYEDRVARRKAEIESLKEAVGILDGTTVTA